MTPPTTPAHCVAADELAMRLAWSTRTANRLVQHELAYERTLGPTGNALAREDLDITKAQIITDRLDRLDGLWYDTALDVQDTLLDHATRRTPTQLHADLERELIRVDPNEATARRTHARTGRRVDRPQALPDKMAGLWTVLPATTAIPIHTTLDTTARTAGDPRTHDQLRADGLTDLILHTTTSCDLDHTIEYHPPPGTTPNPDTPLDTTSTDNLGPLCRRDHRLKTKAGFTLRQPSPGQFEWTTPTGHHYRVIPGNDGWNEHLPTTPPPPPPNPEPDLPPF